MGRGRVSIFHKNAKFIANIRTVGVNITDSGWTGRHRLLIDSPLSRLGACGFWLGTTTSQKGTLHPGDERFLMECCISTASISAQSDSAGSTASSSARSRSAAYASFAAGLQFSTLPIYSMTGAFQVRTS